MGAWVGAGQLTQTEVSQGIFYYELEVRKEQVMQIYKRKQCRDCKEGNKRKIDIKVNRNRFGDF